MWWAPHSPWSESDKYIRNAQLWLCLAIWLSVRFCSLSFLPCTLFLLLQDFVAKMNSLQSLRYVLPNLGSLLPAWDAFLPLLKSSFQSPKQISSPSSSCFFLNFLCPHHPLHLLMAWTLCFSLHCQIALQVPQGALNAQHCIDFSQFWIPLYSHYWIWNSELILCSGTLCPIKGGTNKFCYHCTGPVSTKHR